MRSNSSRKTLDDYCGLTKEEEMINNVLNEDEIINNKQNHYSEDNIDFIPLAPIIKQKETEQSISRLLLIVFVFWIIGEGFVYLMKI